MCIFRNTQIRKRKKKKKTQKKKKLLYAPPSYIQFDASKMIRGKKGTKKKKEKEKYSFIKVPFV